ncbi:MAG: hypothetical protein FWF08_01180 [Oscillospiraceae bacterium]|nr:hypothetical protein [Oscillospiraceae bacterium]
MLNKNGAPLSKSADYAIRIGFVIIGAVTISFGVALSVHANIGMSTYDGMIQTVTDVINRNVLPGESLIIKVGTLALIINMSFVLAQMLFLRKNYQLRQLLQIANLTLGITSLNFFQYNVLTHIKFTGYPVCLVACLLSIAIKALGVMLILESNFIRTPMEGMVQLIADRIHKRLGLIMQILDAFYVIIAFSLAMIFSTVLRVREGTIITVLLFGPMLDLFRKPLRKLKEKYGIMQ